VRPAVSVHCCSHRDVDAAADGVVVVGGGGGVVAVVGGGEDGNFNESGIDESDVPVVE
jgi:hypothetical protein